MRIAIASNDHMGLNSQVSAHFGKCPYYTIVDIENGNIEAIKNLQNPFSEHTQGQVPAFINEQKVNILITGGIGSRAIDFFNNFDIKVISGISGRIANILNDYINGKYNEVSTPKTCKEK